MNDSPAGTNLTLIVFTATYPYDAGGERNFLRAELPYLLRTFRRVILVPERPATDLDPDLPDVEVEDGYAEYLRTHGSIRTFFRGLSSRLVYAELWIKPWLLIRPAFLKRLLFFAGQAEWTRSWVAGWIREQGLQPQQSLFYTYWFDQAGLGIGLAKRVFPGLRLVSRAHRYDLYEELRVPPYWPCREVALKLTDQLFPVSDAGAEYLCGKYPEFSSRMRTARLGVADPGMITQSSSDGIYRIVSCSRIAPVKRLDLMMDGIRTAAERRPSQRFEWRHIGTGALGPLADQRKGLPENVAVNFVKYSTQAALFRYYRENPVDVFVNVSASEGAPVSIMEAMSCGIPVVATAVGGNTEVVSEANGYLIDANPSPDEIADALLAHWDEPGNRRAGSRHVWSRKYDAARNYPDFVKRLVEIRQ